MVHRVEPKEPPSDTLVDSEIRVMRDGKERIELRFDVTDGLVIDVGAGDIIRSGRADLLLDYQEAAAVYEAIGKYILAVAMNGKKKG